MLLGPQMGAATLKELDGAPETSTTLPVNYTSVTTTIIVITKFGSFFNS